MQKYGHVLASHAQVHLSQSNVVVVILVMKPAFFKCTLYRSTLGACNSGNQYVIKH